MQEVDRMRKRNFKGRCEKRMIGKCTEVCRTYDEFKNSIGFQRESLPIFVDNSVDFRGTGSRLCSIKHFYMLMNNSG